MRTAQESVQKFLDRASGASADYLKGAQETDKDQSQRAIAAKPIYVQALTASFAKGSYEAGLRKSGKGGWLKGVTEVGESRYAGGIAVSGAEYATESAKYDTARNISANMPRGLKGSVTNLAKVTAVVNALRAIKVGLS